MTMVSEKLTIDPDFMAKQVPLLDVMRKLQNLESAFPKIKKMESVVEKSSVNLAEINMKMRTVVNLDHFNEKFDELTLQLRRQYQKDVELYEEKTKDFLKAKLDVTEFNKRMSSKVNTYDFDVSLSFSCSATQQQSAGFRKSDQTNSLDFD